jgi:hypothetical protein
MKGTLIGIVGGGVQLGPLGTAATNRPIVPAPVDYDDGEIGGMIGRGNRSTRRKLAPVPLCPPQTAHAARTRTRATTVGSQRLTAWATARPMKGNFLWDVTSCSLICVYRVSEESYLAWPKEPCSVKVRNVGKLLIKYMTSHKLGESEPRRFRTCRFHVQSSCSLFHTGFLLSLLFAREDLRQYVPPKRRLTFHRFTLRYMLEDRTQLEDLKSYIVRV